MNKKFLMGGLVFVLIVITGIIFISQKNSQKTSDSLDIANNQDSLVQVKEFSNDLFSFQYRYPNINKVILKKYSEQYKGVPSYEGVIVQQDGSEFIFNDFDPYKLKQDSFTGGYDYRVINNENATGILFWKSYGAGPYECYEEMDCSPYSDEFQFGYRFDLKDGTVVTFYNELTFNDGKNTHSIDDVLAMSQYQELAYSMSTFRQK